MAHPLCGADLGTLASVTGLAGAPSNMASGAMIALAALARAPFSLAEKAIMEPRLPRQEDMKAPVFILGHWRSGTTHLYNIMCESGEWGFVPPVATGLPWDLFGLAKVFRPLLERALPETRYIDQIPVTPKSPQEDEIAIANMSPLSFYHAIYFPRAFARQLERGLFFDGVSADEVRAWRRRFIYFLRKLYLHQGEKPLLIKNPVYTGRLAMLAELFPDAKFIHIHRNPYDVFVSMRNFYQKLLQQFALQGFDHIDIDEAVLSVYARMMTDFERDRALLPEGRLVEIGYGRLDDEPLGAVSEIYEGLALPGFEAARPQFERYLSSVESFQKNKFQYQDADARRVEKRWARFIEKWGYERPAAEGDPAPGPRSVAAAGDGAL